MMNKNLSTDGSEDIKRNWSRNQVLIDLSFIPEKVSTGVISRYEEIKPATKQQFMNYMITNRLKNLLEVIDEF